MSPSVLSTIWENFKQISIAVILALIIKTSVVEAYKIPSSSMEDTLLIGDFLLANKFVYGARLPLVDWQLPALSEPERGDVIVFIYPIDMRTKYIKRCVGLPGDTIEYRDKQLFVNGERYADPVNSKFSDTTFAGEQRVYPRGRGGRGSRDNFGPYIVPRNEYFMMGDNRDHSSDSRIWATVPRELMLGQALLTHWSWKEDAYPSPEITIADPLSVPRMFIHNGLRFCQKVRWSRLLNPIP